MMPDCTAMGSAGKSRQHFAGNGGMHLTDWLPKSM